MNHARRRRVRGRQVYVDQGGWRIREALQLRRLRVEDLEKFKREATSSLESVKFPVHKWQSDVEHLESKDSTNPSQGQQKHPKVQWKDYRLQPFFYVEGGLFGEKLVAHAHEQIMRLEIAKTMAHVRTD